MAQRKDRTRANGEGSVYKRESDGRWCSVISLGYTGGRLKRKVFYGTTRKEVAEKLRLAQTAKAAGKTVAPGRQTVAQFLDRWLSDVVAISRRPNTVRTYRVLIETHIIPAIGDRQVAALTPDDVQRLISRIATNLQPRTVTMIRAILIAALRAAEEWGLATRNVARLTTAPRIEHIERPALTASQSKQLLRAACDHPLEPLFQVALRLGLRIGEILALRWQDVDFTANEIHVRATLHRDSNGWRLGETKSAHGRRTVPLSPVLRTVLRSHRSRQLEERLQAGATWQDHGLVFSRGDGTPLIAETVRNILHRLLRAAHLPDVRIHDLRHSSASLLMAEGVPTRIIQAILGHGSLAMTERYLHPDAQDKRDALDSLDRRLGEDDDDQRDVG